MTTDYKDLIYRLRGGPSTQDAADALEDLKDRAERAEAALAAANARCEALKSILRVCRLGFLERGLRTYASEIDAALRERKL